MTLVLDLPSAGPATHALVIGVEHPASDAPPFYSAAASAEMVANLLLDLAIQDAPLASLELLRSNSPFVESEFMNPRNQERRPTQPPSIESVRRAARAWRERLDVHSDNIGFFYYVGPTVYTNRGPIILLPASGPAAGSGVSLDDFCAAMAASRASRQLYFTDGCPSGEVAPKGSPISLFASIEPARAGLCRARYNGGVSHNERILAQGQTSLMARGLLAALRFGHSASLRELGTRLNNETLKREIEAGLPAERVISGVSSQVEGDFVWRYRAPGPSAKGKHSQGTGRRKGAVRDLPTARAADGMGAESAIPPPKAAAARSEAGEPGDKRTEAYLVSRLGLLTPRQRQCLRLFADGLSLADVASAIGVSARTVNRDLDNAARTLGTRDLPRAALILIRRDEPPESRPSDEAGADPVVSDTTGKPAREPNTHFVSDDPEVERDDLGRGPLAVALGRRLHRIWCRSNGVSVPGHDAVEVGADDRAAFVLHLDAPWGGGKTSFANFLARVLNPFPAGCTGPPQFLAERAGDSGAVGTIFIDDPPADGKGDDPAADWPKEARRPWIVVPFNAWQAEHCAPPWWVFYQAIRKGCFRATRTEGRRASAPTQAAPRPVAAWPGRLWARLKRLATLPERLWAWAGLWGRELWWRLRNPKIIALLVTAGIAVALFVILNNMGIIFGGEDGPAFDAGNALGFVLAGVGGISGLWALGALLTESVAPGTDAVAERRSLGGGDPFDRFRRHFAKTMKAVKRPVMVIVDDLDRCRPDFVVDLIRGIQTLLRSPRVVFVILGDRDWIERAFEAHHDAMKKVNAGAEQTFGARFVEKAIQMSFILPEMPETRQDLYVRRVLLGPGAGASGATAVPPPPADLSQQLRADYREKVASAETAEDRKQAEQALRDKYQDAFQAAAQTEAEAAAPDAAPPALPDAETAGAQADKLLGEERAMLAAVDERMGKALLHRLEPLARAFPANPRQIKRIVNAITMYTCVAYLQMAMDETDERGVELAIWVILMTEWPATWRLLAGCPDLLAAITADKPAEAKKALRAVDGTLLPGSTEATLEEIMRVRADKRLCALIRGDRETGAPALTLESVREFRALTPLYAGKRKLAAGAASGETAH